MSKSFIAVPRPKNKRLWLQIGHDFVAAWVACALALSLRRAADGTLGPEILLVDAPLFAALAALTFHLTGLHDRVWRYSSESDVVAIVKAVTFAVLLYVAISFAFDRLDGVPRSAPFLLWAILVTMMGGARIVYRRVKAAGRRARQEPVLLIGAGAGADALQRALDAIPGAPFYPVGIIDDEGYLIGRRIGSSTVLGGPEELPSIMERLAVHGVFPTRLMLAKPLEQVSEPDRATIEAFARERGLVLDPAPSFLCAAAALEADRPTSEDDASSIYDDAQTAPYAALKRMADVLGAAMLLVFLAPLALVTWLAVALSMGSPVIFKQVRPGRDLRPFTLYKFRSMHDARDASGKTRSDEERTSAIGAFLRRTRLDEIPQLWNILIGDMSFIGPRPLLPRDLAPMPDGGRGRARVRPGLTGWAQVNGGNRISHDERMALEIWYARRANLWIDAKIVFLTLRTMVFGEKINQMAIEIAYRESGARREAQGQPFGAQGHAAP